MDSTRESGCPLVLMRQVVFGVLYENGKLAISEQAAVKIRSSDYRTKVHYNTLHM